VLEDLEVEEDKGSNYLVFIKERICDEK
jgi:hypothetical protein